MDKTLPLVSICIPTYNGEMFIEQAIESALRQTYTNLEIVISDDNSIDETLSILEGYKKLTHIPFNIFHHEPIGIGANWNNCIKQAKGKYIKFLFQDDLLEPQCVERMVLLAEQIEDLGLVYCKRKILYNETNNFDRRWISNFSILHKSWHNLNIQNGALSGRKYMRDKNLLNHPVNKIGEPTAVLISRDCFDKVGFFSQNLKQALDIEFWYRVMPNYNIGYINEALISFRLHKSQASQVNSKKNVKFEESIILNKLMVKSYFWYLHPKVKIEVIKTYIHCEDLLKFIRKVNNKIKKYIG